MPEPDGELGFLEQVEARFVLATQSGAKKQEFLEAADPEGTLSPEAREAMGAIFDTFVDAVSENIEKIDLDDPMASAANIVAEHFRNADNLKEAAEAIFRDTGIDLGGVTQDKSDDLTQAQLDEIMAAMPKGIEGLMNPQEDKPEAAPTNANDDTSSLDKGYQQGVDGTAFTTEVAALSTGGEPTVDFENGVMVGDVPIGNFFAQNVSPEPENVMMVNAITPESNIVPDVPIIPVTENEQSMQTLG